MKTVSAVFENGMFRPETPLDLPEGWLVSVNVPDSLTWADEAGRLADGGFGCMSAEDAEEMTRIIEERFETVNLDEWR